MLNYLNSTRKYNIAIANLIREGKIQQIASVLERSALLGMQSLDNALRNLLDAQLITSDEARRRATHQQTFAQETVVND
jgi:twitching motility protein PilT